MLFRFPVFGSLLGVLLSCFAAPAQTPKLAAPPLDARLGAPALRQVVERLAADDLRGRALHTGADAAARYLATEFKQAGLQPLPGLAGYEQVFPLYQARSQSLTGELNGAPLAAGQSVLLPGQPEFAWSSTQAHSPRVLRIGAQADLRAYSDSVFNAPADLLVLVHPTHAKWFNSLAAHYWHNFQYSLAPPAARTTVLLLTDNLQPSSYRLQGRTRHATVQARNIVGVLPGRNPARAAEQVVFGAHYDHIGILQPVQGDSIANGADDDASGTAGVLALARYYAHRRDNARTLVFVAFTAEEVGEFGSRYFADQLPDPTKVVAMLNLEMLGLPSKFGPGTAFITGFDKSSLGPILQRNLQGTPYRFEPDPYPEQQLFFRSDNYKLARRGIPAHTISTVPLPTDAYYHSVDDEVSTLDFNGMSAVVQAVALGARGLVAGRDTPTRLTPEAGP